MILYSWIVQTPLGEMMGMDDGEFLCVLDFLKKPYGDLKGPNWLKDVVISQNITPIKKQVEGELSAYFKGQQHTFHIPLRPKGTPFQKLAWEALCAIPYGETRTYGEQSHMMNTPKAARATGSANGKNPISILIPCHRVIGAGGSLGGYNSGLDRKKWLLDLEKSYMPHFVTK